MLRGADPPPRTLTALLVWNKLESSCGDIAPMTEEESQSFHNMDLAHGSCEALGQRTVERLPPVERCQNTNLVTKTRQGQPRD